MIPIKRRSQQQGLLYRGEKRGATSGSNVDEGEPTPPPKTKERGTKHHGRAHEGVEQILAPTSRLLVRKSNTVRRELRPLPPVCL